MIERDLVLILGLALLPLAVVALVAAWADRRFPLPGLILAGLGAAMAGGAALTHPTGYVWSDVPLIALEYLARLRN